MKPTLAICVSTYTMLGGICPIDEGASLFHTQAGDACLILKSSQTTSLFRFKSYRMVFRILTGNGQRFIAGVGVLNPFQLHNNLLNI